MSVKRDNKTVPQNDAHSPVKLEANAAKKFTFRLDYGIQCWLVVASCSLINLILFGIYRSYALLYTALLESYHINRTQASWPFSLCMTIIHLTGPISGLLNSKFTTRTIYVTGCFLATLGIGLCYLATDITDVSVYIGVIQGFGIGLTYVQSVGILSEYFENKLGLANGISTAGGTVEFALENLGLRGSFVMLTSITALTIPLCIPLRHNRKRLPGVDALPNFNNACLSRNSKSYNLQSHQDSLSSKRNGSLASLDKFAVSLKKFQTLSELDTEGTFDDTSIQHELDSDNERHRKATISTASVPVKEATDQLSVSIPTANSVDQNAVISSHPQQTNRKSSSLFIIDYNNQDHQQQQTVRENFVSLVKKQLSKFRSRTRRMNSIKQLSKPALKLQNSLSSTNSMVAFTTNNMLTVASSVHFLLIMFSHLAYFWAIVTYQMVIVDFAMDCNIPRYLANNMITSFSLGDLFGRLASDTIPLSRWIIDHKFCANKTYFLITNFLIAVLLNALNFFTGYYGLLLVTLLLGILAGAIVILINVCLCEYLGKKKASLGFGMSAFCCGLATLTKPNLIGYFRDVLGSYNGLFHLLSVLCYTASLLWAIEIVITKIKIRQKLSSACTSTTADLRSS